MFRWLRRLFRRRSSEASSRSKKSVTDKQTLEKPEQKKGRQPIPNPPGPSSESTTLSDKTDSNKTGSDKTDSNETESKQTDSKQPVSPDVTTVEANRQKRKSVLDDLKPVLNVLRAYVVTFGQPDSEMELRAVVGAIVANLSEVTIENAELEGFTDEAIAAFKSLGVDPTLVDVGSQLLAEQVAVWRREQEATVTNVISAYLQQFAPDNADWKTAAVINLTQNVVATLNDGSLSRSGGRVLVDRVVDSFDLEKALSRWVAPEWIALAQRVANYVEKGDLQSELRSIAWAYVQQFQSILSPQLIERIMEEDSVTVTPEEFFSGSLTDFSEMLYYKFQLLQADPEVTKSHVAIAADVHRAVTQFKEQQPPGLDVTKGVQTDDLGISSPLTRKRRRPNQ